MPDTAVSGDSFVVQRRRAVARCGRALDQMGLGHLREALDHLSLEQVDAMSDRLEAVLASLEDQ